MVYLQTSKFTAFSVCSGVPKENAISLVNVCINSRTNASCENVGKIGSATSEFKKGVIEIFEQLGKNWAKIGISYQLSHNMLYRSFPNVHSL